MCAISTGCGRQVGMAQRWPASRRSLLSRGCGMWSSICHAQNDTDSCLISRCPLACHAAKAYESTYDYARTQHALFGMSGNALNVMRQDDQLCTRPPACTGEDVLLPNGALRVPHKLITEDSPGLPAQPGSQ